MTNVEREWETVWHCVPISLGYIEKEIHDSTQKIWIHNTRKMNQIRLMFSNPTVHTLVYEKVTVANCKTEFGKLENVRSVMVNNKTKIEILPGEIRYSDPLEWNEENDLVVSLFCQNGYLEGGAASFAQKMWCVAEELEGDRTEEKKFSPEMRKACISGEIPPLAWGVCAIEGKSCDEEKVQTIALFGDSITQMAYFSDMLLIKLEQKYCGKYTLANCGICGNRLLYDAGKIQEIPGNGYLFGIAGIRRFEKDVFTTMHPDKVLILEGINDCSFSWTYGWPQEEVTAEMLITGYKTLIDCAHRYNCNVIMGTLMPCGYGKSYEENKAESVRNTVNAWIRNQKYSDAVTDFDLAVRKKKQPWKMKEDYHLGDGLHPNFTGGSVMSHYMMKTIEIMDKGENDGRE